jgi:quinol---cytochrome c reductase iron-sulfur subunit, bacillus type
MCPSSDTPGLSTRRRALVAFVNTAVALVGGALTALLGAFALRPQRASARERWIHAGAITDLKPNVPVPKVLAVSRVDGWYRERARETVFLVWDGDSTVRALSATCTHLGCQVRWDTKDKTFICPCHGGVYDATGKVVGGPPPRPLDSVQTRVDVAADTVLVRV